MTNSQALARVFESYTEDELLNAKDEPDTEIAERFTGTGTVVTLFGDDAHATRRRVKAAFVDAGHGKTPAAALTNARRIFRQDEAR
jgi:hypothetical protein